MDSREAAPRRGSLSEAFAASRRPDTPPARALAMPRALAWAIVASTLRRLQRGEGALLAVNLSLIVRRGLFDGVAVAGALVSALTIVAMYALNDLHDAPTDARNPKKDRALIAVYLAHGRAAAAAIAALKLALLAYTWTALGPRATVALAGVLAANLAYSAALKGLPIVDVAWCGLWGALYAALVSTDPLVWTLVGLMTAVCHLFQALDDRDADAANAITTTAVRSAWLSTTVLAAACTLLAATLAPAFGFAWAATAFVPLAVHLTGIPARTGWLLSKAYFAVMWLAVLSLHRAAS